MAWLQRERTHTDTDLAQAIQDSPIWREKDDLLRSVPGVWPVLTTTVLANLPELGTLTNKQIAALVGVAPLNRDSGTLHGKRMVRREARERQETRVGRSAGVRSGGGSQRVPSLQARERLQRVNSHVAPNPFVLLG